MEMFSACTPEKTKSHKAHFSLFCTKEKYYSGKENNGEVIVIRKNYRTSNQVV